MKVADLVATDDVGCWSVASSVNIRVVMVTLDAHSSPPPARAEYFCQQ